MSSYNKVILMGNLTKTPELRVTASGLSVGKFTIAVNRSIKSEDGSMKEEATFIDVDCFGKTAENISKFFTKGKPIFLEGRLRLNEWESKNATTGQSEKRSKLTVVLERFEFIGSKSQSEDGSSQSNPYEAVSPPKNAFKTQKTTSLETASDEDIPF